MCESFRVWHQTNKNTEKDTYGFSLGDFKTYTRNGWRLKLYEYYLKNEEKLSNPTAKAYKSVVYKNSLVHTEEKRNTLLENLFPGDAINIGFHRVARDIVNKHAIIIDIDNKTCDISVPMIEPAELLSKIKTVNYIAYSSFSNTTEHQKFRVIIPTDRPFTLKENDKLKHFIMLTTSVRVNHDYIQNIIDITCYEPSRFFYVPVNKPNNNKAWMYIHEAGNFFPVDDALKSQSRMAYRKEHLSWHRMKELRKEVASA